MTIAGFADLRRRIADLPVPQPLDGPCLIYGAGGFGRRVARELRRLGLPTSGSCPASSRTSIPGRFRLRQHGHHAFDTVLYVTPA